MSSMAGVLGSMGEDYVTTDECLTQMRNTLQKKANKPSLTLLGM